MKLAFVASPKCSARQALESLIQRYGQSDVSEAYCLVCVGGDGTVLRALQSAVLPAADRLVFPMRLEGSVGYLTNRYSTCDLHERIEAAPRVKLRPLVAKVKQAERTERTLLSFSEIVVMRQRLQAAHLHVKIGGMDQSCPLVGDGLLIATPIGSSGYNRSQGGPYLPLNSPLLTVTGLAVHHASNWRNAVIADRAPIEIEVESPTHRPVRSETYFEAVSDVSAVSILCSHSPHATLLLEERPWLW